jgi:UDP-galactopyranose mutase
MAVALNSSQAWLPAAILRRLPTRLTFDDNYFDDRYQGVPEGGYTPMFERLLDGIEVKLGCDYLENRHDLDRLGNVVYSGRVDALYDYRYGELEFRTCRFDTKVQDGDYQGNPVIHHLGKDEAFTRTIEHKHFEDPRAARSPVTWEYPEECARDGKPFYPINDARNQALYEKYAALGGPVILGGRLGKYRYIDMHQVIALAWTMADRLS